MSPANSSTRKRPARAAADTAPPEPDTTVDEQEEAEDGPIVIPVGKPAKKPEGKQIPVFTYGETTFTMPAVVSLQQAAQVVRAARQLDPVSGGLEVVRVLCGQEAVNVLLEAPEIEDGHITGVVERVSKHVFGVAEEVGKASDGA